MAIYFLLIPETNSINSVANIYAVAVPKSGSITINPNGTAAISKNNNNL